MALETRHLLGTLGFLDLLFVPCMAPKEILTSALLSDVLLSYVDMAMFCHWSIMAMQM